MPAATHAQFVEHIRTVLDSISGVGVIHTRPRDLQNIEDIETDFTSGTPAIINAWVIQREAVRISRTGVPGSHEHKFHTYIIRGFYQMSDDLKSDDIFQQLLNDIMDAFRPARAQASASATFKFEDTDSFEIPIITLEKLADAYWVHSALIRLVFRERVQQISYYQS